MASHCPGCGNTYKRLQMHIGYCKAYQVVQSYQYKQQESEKTIQRLERENQEWAKSYGYLVQSMSNNNNITYYVQNNFIQNNYNVGRNREKNNKLRSRRERLLHSVKK